MTKFQSECLSVIRRSLNGMNSTWTIATIVYGDRWNTNRRGRAGMVAAVQRACNALLEAGHLGARIDPRDRFDHATYALPRFSLKQTSGKER